MSDKSHEVTSSFGIALGTLVPTVLAALCGIAYFLPAGSGTYSKRLLDGSLIGSVSMLLAAFSLSWHATAVRQAPEKLRTAPLWGLIPGALVGGTLASVFGGVTGYLRDALGDGIRLGALGVLLGPVAWQLAYWADEIRQSITHRRLAPITAQEGSNDST